MSDITPAATAPPPVAEISEASKWYGDVIGLNQVSLQIQPGITGLLGPNGAGKSTFLKLLTGQLRPSRGRVRVLGRDPWHDRDLFRHVGYCPDSEQLYEEMTGRAFVQLMGRLAGYSAAESRTRAELQLERVSMNDHAHRLIHGYSKGMRQRVRLAAALIHNPQLVILDEPLNGLDPMGRIEMMRIFRRLSGEGCSVIVSSHILHEIETLTRRMIMLHRGRVIAEGEIDDVRALLDRQPLTLRLTGPRIRDVAAAVIAMESVTTVEFPTGPFAETPAAPRPAAEAVIVRTNAPEQVLQVLQQRAGAGELEIHSIEALDDNLDAIFHYLVQS